MTATTFSRLRAVDAKSPITLACQVSPTSAGAFLALALLVAATTALTASAQSVTYAGAGAVNFGSVNVCPSGKTAPAPCSQTLALTYNVTESGTLGTPKALTTGATNLDYKIASGTTCTGSVTKGNTCKVNVTFAPIAPGARDGAVQIVDSGGHVLATTYIYGTGVGPRISFNAPNVRSIGGSNSSFSGPVAVDGSGNLFAAIPGMYGQGGFVEELLAVDGAVPANPVVKALAQAQGTFAAPTAIAVDGAGNVFFTVSVYTGSSGGAGYLEELLAADGYSTSNLLGGSFAFADPNGIAVDGSGNLFVSENYFNDITLAGALYELPAADGYSNVKTLAKGTTVFPYGIALDAGGNLFVANNYANILEFSPSDGYTAARTIDTYAPAAIALDPAGNLFASIYSTEGSSPLIEFFAVDGVLPSKPGSQLLGQVVGGSLAFDSSGNLFDVVGSIGLQELQLATPPTVDFAQSFVGHTSSDSPRSVVIQNEGTAPLDLSGLSLDSPNFSLVKGSGSPKDCAAGASLGASALCNVSVSFKPTEGGPLTSQIDIADNSLNAPGAQQAIQLKGYGDTFTPPHIASLNTTYAAHYSVVILYGTNFGANQGSSTVTFNGIPTPHYAWSNTQIYVTVPPTATTGNVVVTVGGETSNPVPFTVVPMPVVTGISPISGPPGTVVTITGSNLFDYYGNDVITFNGTSTPLIGGSTSYALLVAVPAKAATGHFHVLVNDTGINTPTFTVTK